MKLDITEINRLASIANRIDNTINNANTEMETLKQYVIETVNKCQNNIKEMTSFIKKNKNLFWKPRRKEQRGSLLPSIEPVNGFKFYWDRDHGITDVNYVADDFEIRIDIFTKVPRLASYRGKLQLFHSFSYEKNNTNIEYWYDMKKRADNYKKYMEIFITKFESMVKCIVAKKLAHMQSIVDATNDVVKNQPIVKEIKIVVVT